MTTEIKRAIDISIAPTPDELAEVFWGMNSGQQAQFFNRLQEISGNMLCFQLQVVTDEPGLDANGRHAMQLIGEYSEEANHDH